MQRRLPKIAHFFLPVAIVGLTSLISVASALGAAGQPTPYAYVTGYAIGKVAVINTSTNAVVAMVPVGGGPEGVAITPDGDFAYVVNSDGANGGNSVSVIRTANNAVVATVPVGESPAQVAITPNGAFAYVTNLGANTVSVINTATNVVIATVPVAPEPSGVAITPNGAFAYVTNQYPNSMTSESVTVISTLTNAVVKTIPVGGFPEGVAITPNGARVYVANGQNEDVAVIDTTTNDLLATVPVGEYPSGPSQVAITPGGSFAYVTNSFEHRVSVINTSTNAVVAAVPLASSSGGIAITPNGALAYVAGLDSVFAVNTSSNSVVATLPLVGADGVAISPPIVIAATPEATHSPPPKVKITGHPPSESARSRGRFAFAGVPGGAYLCSIDDDAWRACASGQAFGPLAPGDHLFKVRETIAGETGRAASYRFTIDLPRPCVLRVARARVFAYAKTDRLRLAIHYTAYRPADVTVSYSVDGTALGTASAAFSRAGIFLLPEQLSRGLAGRVRTAKLFRVHFEISKVPPSCGRYYTKRLTFAKKIAGRTVWFQSDSTFAR